MSVSETASNKQQSDIPSASIESARNISISDFTFDRLRRSLIDSKGQEQQLSVKTAELLEILIAHRKQYLPTTELMSLLYQNQAVEPSTLRQQVKKLREHFGDTEAAKVYIETKSSVGYRLIAKVSLDTETEDSSGLKLAGSRGLGKQLLLFALLLTIVMWAVFKQWNKSKPSAQQTETTAVSASSNSSAKKDSAINRLKTSGQLHSLTHLKGVELYPAISPNGRWLIFSYRRDLSSPWTLYLRDMQSDLIKSLTQSGSDKYASWSADGDKVVFTRYGLGSCQLIQSDFDPTTLTLANEHSILNCNADALSTKAQFWPDNKGIYYNQADSVTAPYNTYSWSFEAERGWQMSSTPPSGKGDYNFKLSHDGRQLVVLRDTNWSGTGIWLYDTQTLETRLLTRLENHLLGISWTMDDQYLVFRSSNNQVVKLNIDNKQREIIAEPTVPLLSPLLLPGSEDRLIAVHGSMRARDIEKVSFVEGDKDHPFRITRRQMLAESSFDDYLPTLSHDGKLLAWVSNRGGRYQIWLRDASGTERKLSHLQQLAEFTSLQFNADDTQLAGTVGGAWFSYLLKENKMIWKRTDDQNIYENLSWRAKGNKAYLAKQTGKRWRLLEYDGDKNNIDESFILPAFMAIDSPDGRYRYFANLNEPTLWRQTLNSADESASNSEQESLSTAEAEVGKNLQINPIDSAEAIKIPYQLSYVWQWTATNKALYFVSKTGSQWRLYRLDHDNSSPVMLDANIGSSTLVLPPTQPETEKFFLTTVSQPAETEIVLLK